MLRISIIIPIYGVEKYVEKCLDSIISQECEVIDLECILINDCTPDNSMEVITKKLKDYQGGINFIVKHHEVNRGHCAARNTGLKYASGDYVLFVDSDDILAPKALLNFHNELDKINASDVDVIMGNAYDCQDIRCIMEFDNSMPFLIDNTKEEALRKLLSRELFHTAWNKLVKKTMFIKQNLYFEEGIINEDLLWSYIVFLHAKSVLIVPKVTYFYRKDNPDNITNTSEGRISQIIRSRTIIFVECCITLRIVAVHHLYTARVHRITWITEYSIRFRCFRSGGIRLHPAVLYKAITSISHTRRGKGACDTKVIHITT